MTIAGHDIDPARRGVMEVGILALAVIGVVLLGLGRYLNQEA